MPYLSKKYLNELFQKKRLLYESVKIRDAYENAKNGDKYDVFLSYSLVDKEYALKIYRMMINVGYSVYIDLKDERLDRSDVDEGTARRIAKVMDSSRCLIYVHTASAKVSSWCPWELGYMSGKTNFRCAIIPLLEDKEDFPRQEYLGLYPIVDFAKYVSSEKYEFWVNKYGTSKYTSLKEFANGRDPYEHN